MDLEGGDWAFRFECGSAGFQASAIADVASPRSRGQKHTLPSDAWIGNWMPRGMTLLISRFAEHSSRAPMASASLLLVKLTVPAASTLNIGRFRRVGNSKDEGAVKDFERYTAIQTIVKVRQVKMWTEAGEPGRSH